MALRELAMRQAAYAVESRLPDDDVENWSPAAEAGQETAERLLLVITVQSIERGAHPSRAPGRRLPASGVPGGVRIRDADFKDLTRPIASTSSAISISPVGSGSRRACFREAMSPKPSWPSRDSTA